MLYALFRGLSRVSLRWFYRDVTVLGRDRVPRDGPLLLAVRVVRLRSQSVSEWGTWKMLCSGPAVRQRAQMRCLGLT